MAAGDRDPFSSFSFNPQSDAPAAIFVNLMWWYAISVLYPSQALKSMGLYSAQTIGQYPLAVPFGGEGQSYCLRHSEPVYLSSAAANLESVEEFDRTAEVYDALVAPVTQPVREEVLKLMRRLLPRGARILDLSCGPGTEQAGLAALVPDGEIVGIDLSAGMIAAAFANARSRGPLNTAFFQADVTSLPAQFDGRFDAVHCSFAFHHYRDPAAAIREMHRVLNAHGKAFVIDPGPWWVNLVGAPLSKWADPGWVAFHTGEQFESLFFDAGFSDFYWEEILPAIGVCVAGK